ncbi:hypothetical protein [Mycolicibacterium mucogenicum]|nr:hypothetical protein [Mycolicibacterium mucogenicum]
MKVMLLRPAAPRDARGVEIVAGAGTIRGVGGLPAGKVRCLDR